MPNWCECDLSVEGLKEKIDAFLEFIKGNEEVFDFNRLIPYPDHFKDQDRLVREWEDSHPEPREVETWKDRPTDGYNQGGYEWCVENWGTKWNACNAEVQDIDTWDDEITVKIYFETAWSPPLPVIKHAAKLFPELRFDLRFFECGCAFNGMLLCENGEVVSEKYGAYFGNRGG